jgi:hypothetical protein
MGPDAKPGHFARFLHYLQKEKQQCASWSAHA